MSSRGSRVRICRRCPSVEELHICDFAQVVNMKLVIMRGRNSVDAQGSSVQMAKVLKGKNECGRKVNLPFLPKQG